MRRPGAVLSVPAVLAVLYVLNVLTPPSQATTAATADSPVAAPPTYLGAAACAPCHEKETAQWRGSHHDRAMEIASDDSVLGDFAAARFAGDGVSARFFRKDGGFFVHTAGADGAPRDFAVKYTFGVEPLQQYLLDVGGGRLQAFSVAWDTRPREAGGHRWFDLQPEPVSHDDPLHWTGTFYNWNLRCAFCHSTDLRKNFDLASRSYDTEWSDIDVACEACHGPGSAHVAWAQSDPAARAADRTENVYTVALDTARAEIETCAPCHARRHAIADPAPPGTAFLDAFVPELLRDDLYFADGQIEEEVYVYGSFTQSKMYAAGVRCSDCHDPHGLGLRHSGNAVCTQCHAPGGDARFPTLQKRQYDDVAHHHHADGSAAAQCVTCHMPARTYMVLDDRRDHSMRIPRPDLSAQYGVPNACNGCHSDETADWAAAAIAEWFGPERSPHWTAAIAAGRAGAVDAVALLAGLAGDGGQPAIARATALELLADAGPSGSAVALQHLGDSEPLVRATAATALENVPIAARRAGLALLSDPLRAVRVAAARPLAAIPAEQLDTAQRSALAAAIADYRAAQRVNLDTAEAHLNLGLLHATLGEFDAARREYETAIEIGRHFIPAYVNLADLHRAAGHETEADRVLRQALAVDADDAAALHAHGLSLVRQRKTAEAVAALGRAAELGPGTARYAYTYGVALHSTGKPAEAIAALEAAHRRHPADVDVVAALVSFYRERGEIDAALLYARKLATLVPDDPNVTQLVTTLEQEKKIGTADERR